MLATLLIIFLFFALHPYVTYPLSLVLIKRLSKSDKSLKFKSYEDKKVSIVFCCYNEARSIERKVNNIKKILKKDANTEVLAYVDGSTDDTLELLQKHESVVKIFYKDERKGKSHGMNTLLAEAEGEIIIFTDANVELKENCPDIARKYFANPAIGCICGHLKYTNNAEGSTASTGGLYWRLEEKIKQLESDTGSTMGADGSLFAIRKKLFSKVPEDIIDDFYTSMSILLKGRRVVSAPDFIAYEKNATKSKDEFFRKVRISCRAFNCNRLLKKEIWQMPLLDRYKYYSHKLLRWLTMFFLVGAYLCILPILGVELTLMLTSFGVVVLLCAKLCKINKISMIYEILLAFLATSVGVIQSLRGKKYQTWQIAQSSR